MAELLQALFIQPSDPLCASLEISQHGLLGPGFANVLVP
jgi:hypothetical protein